MRIEATLKIPGDLPHANSPQEAAAEHLGDAFIDSRYRLWVGGVIVGHQAHVTGTDHDVVRVANGDEPELVVHHTDVWCLLDLPTPKEPAS